MPKPRKTVPDAQNAPAPDDAATEATNGARPRAAQDDTVPLPPKIADFEVRRLLGTGTFGRVYLGYDPHLGREVAIKQPFGIGLSEGLRKNFLREAQAIASIIDPNICTVFRSGFDAGLPFIAMQYVPDGTLADMLKSGRPLSLHQTLVFARQIAAGLTAAHAHGITHRDLKPGNILYHRSKNRLLIADFGLAQILGPDVEASVGVKGTPAYMAPEQWSPNKPHPVGPHTDVYALGIILYEMLTGGVPFAGTIMELMISHCQGAARPPSQLSGAVDADLDAIVLRAIAKDPAERYASAQELAEELAVYQGVSINDNPNGETKETQAISDEDLARRGPKTGSRRVPRVNPRPAPPSDSPSKPILLPESVAKAPTAPPKRAEPPPAPPPKPARREPAPPAEPPAPPRTHKVPRVKLPTKPQPRDPDPPKPKRWLIVLCWVLIGVLGTAAIVLAINKFWPTPVVPPPDPDPKGKEEKKDKQKDEPKKEPIKSPVQAPLPRPLAPPSPLEPELRPSAERAPVGRLQTAHVLVLSRATTPDGKPGAAGRRLLLPRGGRDAVVSNEPVVALPGYKADVLLGAANETDVEVRLWGNVPEQLPYRVFESRVTFHQPPAGFDADITLHAGRIYLKSPKPAGARVRLRLAGTREVWDVALAGGKSSVLAEHVSWFVPGAPAGRGPRREGRVVVWQGAADFAAPARFKQFAALGPKTQLRWDSVTDQLTNPAPLAVADEREANPHPPTVGNTYALTDTQTKAADAVADALANRPPADPELKVVLAALKKRLIPNATGPVAQQAAYALAALAESTAGGAEELEELLDLFEPGTPWPVRQAAVTGLAGWAARDGWNPTLLAALLAEKNWSAKEIDEFLSLLRAPVAPLDPDPDALDRALAALGSDRAPVRAAGLWNLLVASSGKWVPPEPKKGEADGAETDPGSRTYGALVAEWKARVPELKKRPKGP